MKIAFIITICLLSLQSVFATTFKVGNIYFSTTSETTVVSFAIGSMNAFKERKDDSCFVTLMDNAVIVANDYNLSVTSYVAQEDTSELVDVTALNAEIAELVECQNQLRAEINLIVAELEKEVL